MPRRFRVPKLRREASIELLAFLLGLCPTPSDLAARGMDPESYDGFLTFDLDRMEADEFLEIWHQHETAVRAHAARLNVPLPNPASYVRGAWVDYSG